MPLAYSVIDAFTDEPFRGNPAAVIVLPEDLAHDHHSIPFQIIAREFNLSETAFLTRRGINPADETAQGPAATGPPATTKEARFGLRWFTPVREVPLCGHATLASAHWLFASGDAGVSKDVDTLRFDTLSGELVAKRVEDDRIEMEFPSGDVTAVGADLHARITAAVKEAVSGPAEVNIIFAGEGSGVAFSGYLLIELGGVIDLEKLEISSKPFNALTEHFVIILTTPAPPTAVAQLKFVSRTFAPRAGIPEDPVTGSAHSLLGPYWARKLGTTILPAKQVSPRGGDVEVIFNEEKKTVYLRGRARVVAKGELLV